MKKSIYSKRQEQFRQLLIEERKGAGLTQQNLADKLKRPQSFVAKCENGERRLDVIEFLEIAEMIGTDPLELLKKLQLNS